MLSLTGWLFVHRDVCVTVIRTSMQITSKQMRKITNFRFFFGLWGIMISEYIFSRRVE